MKLWLSALTAGATLMVGAAHARPDLAGKSPEAAGDALIQHAEDYHAGWVSSHARSHMRMYDKRGKETLRELSSYAIEEIKDADGGETFVIYDRRGSGLHTLMSRSQDDMQWLWIPGLQKRKRINSGGMGASFMGSEFAYEDFRSQYPRKYRNRLLGESQVRGKPVWLIERTPARGASEYSRLTVFLEQEHFRVLNTEFSDKAGRKLKSLQTMDWELRDGRFWRAMKTRMDNLQTGRATVWVTDSIELNAGLTTLKDLMQ